MNSEFEVEAEPAVATAIFGSGIEKARGYAKALAEDSDLLGLLGPREMPKLWSRHILNSAVVAELVPSGVTVADVGSGAGLPGIPMAIAQPAAEFVLIEPMERRANWLQAQVDELGLSNVTVLRARAEEVEKHQFNIVTARAVSALPKLIRMCAPLLKPSGQLLALKGSKAQAEIDDSQNLVKKFKIATFEIVATGKDKLSEPTNVVRTILS
jgi:16S rRNA (guanine527-N7)-methyltransferase